MFHRPRRSTHSRSNFSYATIYPDRGKNSDFDSSLNTMSALLKEASVGRFDLIDKIEHLPSDVKQLLLDSIKGIKNDVFDFERKYSFMGYVTNVIEAKSIANGNKEVYLSFIQS